MDSDAIPVWVIIAIIACAIVMLITYCFPKSIIRKTDDNDLNNKKKISISKRRTILDYLAEVSVTEPKKTAFKIKSGKDWIDVSYRKYYRNVVNFSDSVNHWLGTNVNIGLMGTTCPGWVYSYLGCMMNGGTTVVIDSQADPDECRNIINDFNVQIIVCDGDHLEKFIDIVDKSDIRLIIYYSPIESELVERFNIPIISMGIFVTETNNERDESFTENEICVVDTSGFGLSEYKSQKYTHEQLTSQLKKLMDKVGNNIILQNENIISYLPLNSVVLQIFDIYLPIVTTSTVWFPRKSEIDKSLLHTINEIKPTIFIGNNIWELVQKKYEDESVINKILTKQFIEKMGLNRSKINFYYGSEFENGIKIASSLMNDFKIIDVSKN